MNDTIFEKNLRNVSGFHDIPDQWRSVSIADLCIVGRGRVISQEEINRHPGPYPVFSSQTSNNGEMGHIDTFDFDGEWVTWTTDGANAGTVFHRIGRFNCTNVCGTLQPKLGNSLDLPFLQYHLGRIAKSYVSYIGNPKLMNDVMGRVAFILPPFPEQRKIARILTTVDKLIEKTEALIAKYQAIKQGLMHDLFTRGVDAHGHLRPTPAEAPDLYKQSELGWIPKEWEVRSLTDIASYQTGQPFPSAEYCESGIRLLRPGNLPIDEYVRWDNAHTTFLPLRWESLAAEYLVASGEVVMNLTAQSLEDQFLGRVCVTPPGTHCLLNQRLARFRSQKCHLPFLFWAFKGPHFRFHIDRLTQGTKVQHIYNANLNSARFAVPDDKSEQTKIADILFSTTRTVIAERTRLDNLQQHKTGLMQDLLTGKVRVKVDAAEEGAHE